MEFDHGNPVTRQGIQHAFFLGAALKTVSPHVRRDAIEAAMKIAEQP
jgi:hypothetical protein